MPELAGGLTIDDSSDEEPVELRAAVKLRPQEELAVMFGAGTGIAAAAGTPDLRVFAGFSWQEASDGDPDRDGIIGSADDCPLVPEDRDGFMDEDRLPRGRQRLRRHPGRGRRLPPLSGGRRRRRRRGWLPGGRGSRRRRHLRRRGPLPRRAGGVQRHR
ncbi:MAG: hypothetical protein R3F43_27240 [bacterium]